jgi:hypothetical protein
LRKRPRGFYKIYDQVRALKPVARKRMKLNL